MDVEAEIDQRSGLEWAGGGSARDNEPALVPGAAERALSAGRSASSSVDCLASFSFIFSQAKS